MSLLTYQGKLVNQGGHLVAKFVPPPPVESTILLSYINIKGGLIKSIDSGVNFVYDASYATLGYPITVMCHDPSGDVILCGNGDGNVLTYKNGHFDSSIHVLSGGFGDIAVRGNIRVASNGYSGVIVPF